MMRLSTQGARAPFLVWDNHACPARTLPDRGLSNLARYRAAGADVVALNIGDSDFPFEGVVGLAADLKAYLNAHGEDYALVGSVSEIEQAKAQGRMAVFFDLEGLYAIGEDAARIEDLFQLGVRWMSLVYNRRNALGSGVHDESDDGLTAFGRVAVREMDRLGVIKCCSHTGYRTAREALEITARPTIFSHSNPRALHDHPRNIPDDLIVACAKTDGVVGLNGVGIFLGDNDVRVETLARHIDYVCALVGARHVGLGLDFVFDQDEMNRELARASHLWPQNYGYRPGIRFFAPEDLPDLAEALAARSYSEADIAAIFGGNWRRVAEAVWPETSKS